MRQLGQSLLRVQDHVEEWLSFAAAVAIAAMMVMTVLEVFARYFFRASVPGSYEYVSLLFVPLIYFGLAYSQRRDAHISIGIVYDHLPRRARQIIEGLTLVTSFVLFAVLAWYTGQSAWENYVLGDTFLGAVQVKTWPSRVAVPVGCGMLALRFLVQLSRLLGTGDLYEEVAAARAEGKA